MQAIIRRLLLLSVLLSLPCAAADLVLRPVKVATDVYAVIGDIGQQTYANDGLNNNLGFVVTTQGVLVVNSGASVRVAKALYTAIQQITPQPVKWVINVNSQNQNWLGNAVFKGLNATLLAHKEAGRLMQEIGSAQLQAAKGLLKERADQTGLTYPGELIQGRREIKLGGTPIEILHFGSAHTAGDVVVWLPQQKVLFAGDIVFTERMLAIIPIGNSGGWIKAFDQAMALKPSVIVPGHGRPTNVKKATHDTRDYLAYLRSEVKNILKKNGSLQDAVEKIDQTRFKYLANFDLLAKRNVSQVYTEMEREEF